MSHPPLEAKFWGPYALITRPENKVERVSYPILTPSAARGLMEAIFWKPEFSYRIREIEVLNEIAFMSILRNEVDGKATSSRGISITDQRQQRHSLILKDVQYVVRADIVLKPHATDDVAKYRDQFRRRLASGQCFHRPYFGCREFSADFSQVDPADKPADIDRDLGLMLFDIAFRKSGNSPLFFEAKIEHGTLRVPDSMYESMEALL